MKIAREISLLVILNEFVTIWLVNTLQPMRNEILTLIYQRDVSLEK